MKLGELFEKGEFVVTGEVGPVKGAIPRDESFVPPCAKEAEELHGRVHAINVTDNQSAVMRLGSLAACVRLRKMGYEPIYQITCRDRNRLALQSEILTAFSLGVDNMLLLTGDHTNLGDHKQAKPVFDLDSVQLVKIAADLQKGKRHGRKRFAERSGHLHRSRGQPQLSAPGPPIDENGQKGGRRGAVFPDPGRLRRPGRR